MMGPMLIGKKINLRLMRETDLVDFIRLHQDVSARGEYFPMHLTSESEIKRNFAQDGYWNEQFRTMLIVDAATDRMLGTIVAFKPVFYQDSFEIGYILHDKARRGEGIMAEAVRLFSTYLFAWRNVERIQLQVETPNIPSRRTAEKAGFTHEGTLRKCLISCGVAQDMEMYSLLRSEHAAATDSP